MPLLVQNLQSGPTTFSVLSDNVQIEWQGKDDPGGNDVQHVPDLLAQNVDFLRALQRGIFEIVEAPDSVKDALAKQTSSYRDRQSKENEATVSAIDHVVDNDLVAASCIGPSTRGTGECAEQVPVRAKNQDAKPILCPRHENLASQYVLVEDPDKPMIEKDGGLSPAKKWVRTQVEPRQRATQQ